MRFVRQSNNLSATQRSKLNLNDSEMSLHLNWNGSERKKDASPMMICQDLPS